MTPLESWGTVAVGVFGGSYAIAAMFAAAGRIVHYFHGRVDRQYWVTVPRSVCTEPACGGRVWAKGPVEPYDESVGFFRDTIEVCPACRVDRKSGIEFDMETWTVDDIRALDRDSKIAVGE